MTHVMIHHVSTFLREHPNRTSRHLIQEKHLSPEAGTIEWVHVFDAGASAIRSSEPCEWRQSYVLDNLFALASLAIKSGFLLFSSSST